MKSQKLVKKSQKPVIQHQNFRNYMESQHQISERQRQASSLKILKHHHTRIFVETTIKTRSWIYHAQQIMRTLGLFSTPELGLGFNPSDGKAPNQLGWVNWVRILA